MFTGIIQSVAKVIKTQKSSSGLKLAVNLKAFSKNILLGDSVAINGVCLTATKKTKQIVWFDVVKETLSRTNLGKIKTGESVNIELAIKAGEPFGGHFVQGHIDGTGVISRKTKQGKSYLLEVKTKSDLTGQMIEKGSVSIDGISLTIASIKKGAFTVALIPHTIKHTNLNTKSRGSVVNIELDMMGKFINKLIGQHRAKPKGSLRELL